MSIFLLNYGVLGAAGGGGGGGDPGGEPGDIFLPTNTLSSNDPNEGNSLRVVCTVSSNSLGQIRVTINSGGPGSLIITNVAIGKNTGAASATTDTPLVLNFGGSPGVAIPADSAATSDWLTHSGSFSLTTGEKIVVIIDVENSGGAVLKYSGSNSNASTWYATNTTTYNQSNPAGLGSAANLCFGVSRIETQ